MMKFAIQFLVQGPNVEVHPDCYATLQLKYMKYNYVKMRSLYTLRAKNGFTARTLESDFA